MKLYTKWRWSKFSGLTIFKFTNHDDVTFFLARTTPSFSHFPRQVEIGALPFDFMLEIDPKNIFYYQCDVENYEDQDLDFLLSDKH